MQLQHPVNSFYTRRSAPMHSAPVANAGPSPSSPMADATFCPAGTPESALGLDMDGLGNFWRQSLYGPQKVGAIDATGHYWFVSGQQGDLFENRNPAKEGILEIELSNQSHPMIQALRAQERQRALAGSEVPGLRAKLNPFGLTGQGIKIGILDPYDMGEEEELGNGNVKQSWIINDHSKATARIIDDPVWGIAPGAKVVDAGFVPNDMEGTVDTDDISAARINFIQTASSLFNDTTQRIYQLLQQKTPDFRILSLTWGASMLSVMDHIRDDLNARKENGDYYFPNVRHQLLGPTEYQGPRAQDQALLNFIMTMYQHPTVQQARQRYIEATRQAAARGLIIVAAAGNEHGQESPALKIPPGMEMDELAKSPYVISVAAADTHQTPGYQADDSITSFSSWGDGLQYNPTIAAPGQNIYIPQRYETMGSNQVESGTSFAVPYVCGLIANLLQKEPYLSFEQVKARLQQAALPLPGYPVAAQGAGVIQPERLFLPQAPIPSFQPKLQARL